MKKETAKSGNRQSQDKKQTGKTSNMQTGKKTDKKSQSKKEDDEDTEGMNDWGNPLGESSNNGNQGKGI